MKRSVAIPMLIGTLILAGAARAQEKPAQEEGPRGVPVKVDLTFNEYQGEKKVSALTYTLHAMAFVDEGQARGHGGTVRMGVRVPIEAKAKPDEYQYTDVGTNIDCDVVDIGGGRFRLRVREEFSSVFTEGAGNRTVIWQPGAERPGMLPLVRSFRGNFEVVIHDGQTTQGLAATDPTTGATVKVEVTLTVEK